MSDGHLHRYFLNNGEQQLVKWVHYFDIYERHFRRFVNKQPTILEIGVWNGGSLKMWQDYFGNGVQIIGIDNNPECKQFEQDNIEIFIGSQDDEELLNNIIAKYPNVDVVLDDGSHMMRHMKKSFEVLYPKISDNGVYAVEDTHTCYWEEYEGGLGKSDTFIEFAKFKIDEISAVHSRNTVPVTDFTRSTDAICFYDSVIVFAKRKQGYRQATITAPML